MSKVLTVIAVAFFTTATFAAPSPPPPAAVPPPANGEIELARKLESAFVKVAAQASEAVVVITSTHKAQADAETLDEDEGGRQFEGTPFEYFFRRHGLPMPMPQPRDIDSQGSGIILRRDGYILTNNHVVDGADKIKVRLKNGKEFEAKLVGVDPRTDIAVIKVDATDLPAARLGDSDKVKVGQWAIAIGAPYELDYSFTVGFVSATGRSALSGRSSTAYEDYIQTDASINPGNSGGPLCDIEGRVIGMNTLIRGLNRGIGFAIPINMAREIADKLVASGKVVRPWLGIAIQALSENKEYAELNKDVKEGVVVTEINRDTPAAASDLKQADIIVAVDGKRVATPKELQLEVLSTKVGQKLTLDVVRGSKTIQVTVQTAEMPDRLHAAARRAPGKSPGESAFGLTIQTLTKELAERFKVGETEGVLVTDVTDGSIAAEKGFQRGDVITEVDRAPVRNTAEFKAAMEKADPKKGVLIFFKRGGASAFVVLKEK